MSEVLHSRKNENIIRITVEFLEDGYVLKSGRSKVHRYDLDLLVRDDITLNALLGAVYAGIRRELEERYGLQLKDNLAGIVYQDLQDPFAHRAADGQRGNRRLRPQLAERLRMRVDAMRYRDQRRRLADMEERYPMLPDDTAGMTPEEKERLGWIVCWQVFHECYHAYVNGYPDKEGEPSEEDVHSAEYLCHPVISRSSVDLRSDDNGAYYGAARHPQLQLVRKRDGERTLRDLGFLTTTRLIFDPVLWHYSGALYDERKLDPTIGSQLPYFEVGDHQDQDREDDGVSILPLVQPPRWPDLRQMPQILLPPLIMLTVILAMLGLGGELQTDNIMGLMGIMVSATVLTGGVSWFLHWFTYWLSLRRWLRPYEAEIRQTLRVLVERQGRDCAMMQQAHPPVWTPDSRTDLVSQTLEFSSDIYGLRPGDWDFLKVRLGTSAAGSRLVPSVFPVTGVSGEGVFSEIRYKNIRGRNPESFRLVLDRRGTRKKKEDPNTGSLSDLPEDIAREYGHLTHAPVLLDMKSGDAHGLVFRDRDMEFDPFLENLVLDLCFHHSPEHLQFVMLCPREQNWKERHDRIRRFKHLPHFDELLKDRSAFAFSKKEAWELFDQLQTLRLCHRSEGQALPHIVVIVQEEYDLRTHPLGETLRSPRSEADTADGITFLFCKRTERELPPRCTSVLVADRSDKWFLLPGRRKAEQRANYRNNSGWERYRLEPDPMVRAVERADLKADVERCFHAFKILSALRHREEDRSRVPALLELFQMLTYPDPMLSCGGQTAEERRMYQQDLYVMLSSAIKDNWSVGRIENLAVPIGRTEDGLAYLDLHELQAGPHLLITGNGRTGKTSAAITYFCVLGLLYSPEYVTMIPVDLHGRGLARAMKQLPHTREGSGLEGGERMDAVRYIRSLIQWLDDEILRRKQLLGQLGEETIDAYNRRAQEMLRRIFVAIDDFDDLANIVADHVDLPGQMSRLLRSCENLGIHVVLISDKLEPSISPDLMDQLDARLCMRLSDAGEAKRIVGINDPARENMPGNGRAYLRGSLGTMAEYVQVAYSGSDICGSAYTPFQVVLAAAGGAYSSFFDSKTYVPPSDADADAWAKAAREPVHIVHGRKKTDGVKLGGNAWHGGQPSGGSGDARHGGQPFGGSGDARYGDQPFGGSGDARHGGQPSGGSGDARYGDQPFGGSGDVRRGSQPSGGAGEPEAGAYWEKPDQTWTEDSGDRSEDWTHQPWEAAPENADWKERYFRRWRPYNYSHVPPQVPKEETPLSGEWIRPDEVLVRRAPFGISQQDFTSWVMRNCAAREETGVDMI